MTTNRKALQGLVMVAAVKVAVGVELGNVATSIVSPADCACDSPRVGPIPLEAPSPEERPQVRPIGPEKITSAASYGGRQISALGYDGAVARG